MQTGYTGLSPLYTNLRYDGGFCEFLYTPKENIAVWPSLGTNQELVNEPVLKVGTTWYGPIRVPDNSLGLTETQEPSKAGPYYKQRMEGVQPGDGRENRIVLENMPYYEYILAGKQRAGGFYLFYGSEESAFTFDHDYDGGKGAVATAHSAFSFSGESLHKGLILPSFLGQTSTPSPGAVLPGGDPEPSGPGTNEGEIIEFSGTATVTIPWTTPRKNTFGAFPLIQVWFKDTAIYTLANVPIWCDSKPPDTSLFTIDLTGVSEGFIQIK